jgi:hypothetical protein
MPKYCPLRRGGTKAAIQLNHAELPKDPKMLVIRIIGGGSGCCISKAGEDKEDSTGLKSKVKLSEWAFEYLLHHAAAREQRSEGETGIIGASFWRIS